jgi:hypothetical protein
MQRHYALPTCINNRCVLLHRSCRAATQHRMYATLLAQPLTWVCSTRQTAHTSSISDGLRCILGHFVLPWSFHNPVAVHRSLLVVILCLYLYRSRRLPAAPRNATVRRAYPQPVACRSGVPDGRNRCRKRSVVPIARIMAGHPCGTVATAPAWAVVPPARITAGHPCGTVVTAPACAVVPITRITAEPYKNIQIYINIIKILYSIDRCGASR